MDKVAKGMSQAGREAAPGNKSESLTQRIWDSFTAAAHRVREFFKGANPAVKGFPR